MYYKLFMMLFIICFCALSVHPVSAQITGSESAGESIAIPVDVTPEQLVIALEQRLLAMAQLETASHSERMDFLQPVIERALAGAIMGRYLLGPAWQQLDADQQQQFEQAFITLSIATYARRFKDAGEQSFTGNGKPPGPRAPDDRRALVRRQLELEDGSVIPFDYALLKNNDQWRILNITARGVSDLAIKRTQYRKLFADGGFAAVIGYIESEVDRMAADDKKNQ